MSTTLQPVPSADRSRQPRPPARKVLAAAAAACGVGLIVLVFAISLFPRAAAGGRVLDRFRQTMSTQGLHSLAHNFATVNAAVAQFTGQATAQLAHDLGMTSSQFAAFERRDFPAVAAALQGLPPLVAFVSPVNAQLQRLHPQFAAVDSLPFLGLPLTTIPWLLIAVGVALLTLAGWLLLDGRAAPVACAAGLGLALIVIPLALSYPAKASAAKRVQSVGNAALSPAAVSGATKATMLIDGLVTQVQDKMVPTIAHRLNLTTAQLSDKIAREDPALARGLSAWPSIKPGALHLISLQRASLSDVVRMNGLAYQALPWYVIGPGIVLLVIGSVAALAPTRGPRSR
jgi:hypothetical protein